MSTADFRKRNTFFRTLGLFMVPVNLLIEKVEIHECSKVPKVPHRNRRYTTKFYHYGKKRIRPFLTYKYFSCGINIREK